jgi:hypothetical protein
MVQLSYKRDLDNSRYRPWSSSMYQNQFTLSRTYSDVTNPLFLDFFLIF